MNFTGVEVTFEISSGSVLSEDSVLGEDSVLDESSSVGTNCAALAISSPGSAIIAIGEDIFMFFEPSGF